MAAILRIHRDEPPEEPDPPQTVENWSLRLVGLLSQLDHLSHTIPARIADNPTGILGTAEAMVMAVEALAASTQFSDRLLELQTEALARAGSFFSTLQETRSAIGPGGLLGSIWTAIAGPTRQSVARVRCVLIALHEAITAYFTLFTREFATSREATDWVDAAAAFLAEFKQQLRELPD